jgi:hypothetical protein
MTEKKFPQFPKFACLYDSITWTVEGFTLTATLEHDAETKPTDFECYSERDIQRWKNDDWFYVGVVVSVYFDDVELSDHAASLWGIDCNFSKTSNAYLAEVAQELQAEALSTAKTEAAKILAVLKKVPA